MEELLTFILEVFGEPLVKFLLFFIVSFGCLPIAVFVAIPRPGPYLQNVFSLTGDMAAKVCGV